MKTILVAALLALSTLAQASVYIYCEPLPGGGQKCVVTDKTLH